MTEPTNLRPRSERCPEPECQAGGECWRCDYEESQAPTPVPPPAGVRDQTIKALSRVLLDSGGRLVPKHIAETARAVQDSADAVLRVPAIAEALMATAAVADIARGYCPDCGRGDAAPTADQWLEQKQRADEAEAAVARVRHALMNQSYLTSLDETIAAALDPQEQL